MSDLIHFTKMHGTGNDFIVINCFEAPFSFNASLIEKLSNRNKGIGFDQLLVVEPATKANMDFKYRIFNCDGSEVEQCGNGARCFAVFVTDNQLTTKKLINVETNVGNIVLSINDDQSVTVDMGKPIFTPSDIPFNVANESNSYKTKFNNLELSFAAVSMGNPHAVIEKSDISNYDIKEEAVFFQNNALFPNSVNVGFMQIMNKNTIKLRVYERGAGETLACGSGACAAVVAGIIQGKLNNTVDVHLLGGDVTIEYKQGNHVFLTGPANSVFQGTINLDKFND